MKQLNDMLQYKSIEQGEKYKDEERAKLYFQKVCLRVEGTLTKVT